jgi:transitional endoplasmic reticulum ATPase
MTRARPQVRVRPLDLQAFKDRILMASDDAPDLTLRELLHERPALTLDPLEAALLDLRVSSIRFGYPATTPDTPLYLPPGLTLTGTAEPAPPVLPEDPPIAPPPDEILAVGSDHPTALSERDAVLIAHRHEINQVAAYLESGLSVLVQCEKLLVEYLAKETAIRAGRKQRLVEIAAAGPAEQSFVPGAPGANRRSKLIDALQQAVTEAVDGEVVVVPHLDLLAGGSDASLTSEARDLTDLLYERSGCIMLGFTDPSLVIPDVLAKRFAVRVSMDILPRTVITSEGAEVGIGRKLVTEEETRLFNGFDADALYQNVAGMNAVRLRNGIRFAFHKHREAEHPTFDTLLHELRVFKASTSSDAFEVPDTEIDDIGGYDDVKRQLESAIEIVNGAADIPEDIRKDLVPRGFIFYGPPGTGKTMFAKAIAKRLGGTILVVSGPEITDKYVGESERKVRDIFAQARRNAPAVVVFDEFDSIAGQRSGRDDGGSRAGNAIVAQLLTELDGFRPATPVLIIGTTNRLDLIDEALLRPSRFRPIGIGLPIERARFEIAGWHAEHFGYDLSDDLLHRIARATEGMNGDEIGSVFRDARFDELVGSRRPADARTFGNRVGALLATRQKRDIDRAKPPSRPAEGERLPVVVIRRNPTGHPDDPAATRGNAS